MPCKNNSKGGKAMKKETKKLCIFGILIGFINALFGAGGGMIAVPLLKNAGCEQKTAQATALCIILPLTLITSCIYLLNGFVKISDAIAFIIPGFFGAILGSGIFQKFSNSILKKAFAVFMLWAGIKMITA